MTTLRKAGIYARKSTKDDDEEVGRRSRSVEDQLVDCRQLIAKQGWVEATQYVEDATSAFKKKPVTLADGRRVMRNVRPHWKQMLDDLWHGRIDVLVAYDLDRAMREPRDLEDLIEVVEQTKRYVTTVTGSLGLSNDAEVTMARVGAAMANKSSRDTSRRVKRAARRRAEAGHLHGSVASYGYTFDKDPAGRVTTMIVDPGEAAVLHEAAKRVLAGETMYGICKDFNERGLRTRVGADWISRTLRRNLTTPTVAALREYDGQLHNGQWEPIFDRTTWDRLVTLFDDPVRKENGFNGGARRKYALSGLVVCGTCNQTMRSMTAIAQGRAPSFVCYRGSKKDPETGQFKTRCASMRISMASLEPYIVGRVHAYLSSDAFQRAYDEHQADNTDTDQRSYLARDKEALDRAKTLFIDGDITRAEYDKQKERIEQRMADAEAAIQAATREVVLSNLPAPDEFVRLWKVKDNVWRRTVLSAVIKEIRVYSWNGAMASTITQRKNESDEDFQRRQGEHNTAAMRDRVVIVGWDGKDWPS